MARRVEPADSLDFFCTPPWAARALPRVVLPLIGFQGWEVASMRVWEPAAGRGTMAEPIRETFGDVYASDVHDYGVGYPVGSFVGAGGDLAAPPPWRPDWIVTNPPFRLSIEFAERALEVADSVALLVRFVWLESDERYELFQRHRPTDVALYMGRVPMVRGGWKPKARSATAYAWVLWNASSAHRGAETHMHFIPSNVRTRFWMPDDVRRFAQEEPAPLLEPTWNELVDVDD